jgi:hypothetical protein
MARHILSKKEYYQKADFYQKLGLPFIVERCGNSNRLKFGGQEFYYYAAVKRNTETGEIEQNKMPISQIHFISEVKSYITKNNLHEIVPKNYKDINDIRFIGWNQKRKTGDAYNDCYCVDISGAYWNSAYMQGYINKTLYDKGQTVDKRIRLACLGTFAKVSYIWKCDNGEMILDDLKRPTHPQVFFNCANHIYLLMNECKNAVEDDFLFFWTDCINVRTKESLTVCENILKKNGFKYKSQELDYVRFTDKAILVGGKNGKKEKTYNISIGGDDEDTVLTRLEKRIKENKYKGYNK